MTENTAKFAGGNYLRQSWRDLVEQAHKPEDKRTSEEVIADLSRKLEKIGKGGK